MPAISNTTQWRTHPHAVEAYFMAMPVPVSLPLKVQVNQTSFTYPIGEITYDTVIEGSTANTFTDQTIRVTDSSGNFKGWLRLRGYTASLITFGYVSQGEIDFANDDILEFYDDARPFMKIPRIDAGSETMYKDYDVAFSSVYGTQPPPVCVPGPDRAGFVDPTTNLLTLSFNLQSSYAIADGATIDTANFSADLGSGVTITSGTVASGIFTATFPRGVRLVSFTCVDTNVNSHTAFRLIGAYERSGSYEPIKAGNFKLTNSKEDGWELTAEIAQGFSQIEFVKGSRCVLWVNEYYGSTNSSLGGVSGSENIKFVGYIDSEDIEVNPKTNNLIVHAVGPLRIMEGMTSFPQTVTRDATPATWDELAGLDAFKFIWYILHWHSNFLSLFDSEKPGWASSFPVANRLDTDAGSFKQAVEFATNAVGANFTADFQGRLYFRKNPQLFNDTYRDTVATIVTLTEDDWFSKLEVERTWRTPLMWLRGAAFVASATELSAVMSLAPGLVPGQGNLETMNNYQLVSNQADLNTRTGYAYALEKRPEKPLKFGITHGGLAADPAWQEWVVFTLSSSSNKSGLRYTSERFILQGIQVDFDGVTGEMKEWWTLDPEVFGAAGVTIHVPTNEIEDPEITPPPDAPQDLFDVITTTDPDDGIAFADAPAMFVASTSAIGRTFNHTAGSPNYERIVSSSQFTGYIRRMILDPWAPRHRMYFVTKEDDGTTASTLRLYEATNIMAAAATVSVRLLYTSVESTGFVRDVDLKGSINLRGFVCLYAQYAGNILDRTVYIYRTTYTGSFTRLFRNRRNYPLGNQMAASIALEHHANSFSTLKVVMNTGPTADGFATYCFFDRSTDGGATLLSDGNITPSGIPGMLIFPYIQNAAQDLVYYAVTAGSGGTWNMSNTAVNAYAITRLESTFGTYTKVGVAPLEDTGGGVYRYIAIPGNAAYQAAMAFHVYTLDNQELAFVSGSATGGYLYRSSNAGSSWSKNACATDLYAIGGWPYDKDTFLIWGHSTLSIKWTTNSGTSWNEAIGDFETTVGGTGIVQLVPVWIP